MNLALVPGTVGETCRPLCADEVSSVPWNWFCRSKILSSLQQESYPEKNEGGNQESPQVPRFPLGVETTLGGQLMSGSCSKQGRGMEVNLQEKIFCERAVILRPQFSVEFTNSHACGQEEEKGSLPEKQTQGWRTWDFFVDDWLELWTSSMEVLYCIPVWLSSQRLVVGSFWELKQYNLLRARNRQSSQNFSIRECGLRSMSFCLPPLVEV